MSSAGPLEPLSVGGIAHALVGTLVIMAIALVITVPLGILCAVFLNETRGRFTQFVRTIVTAMTALPVDPGRSVHPRHVDPDPGPPALRAWPRRSRSAS